MAVCVFNYIIKLRNYSFKFFIQKKVKLDAMIRSLIKAINTIEKYFLRNLNLSNYVYVLTHKDERNKYKYQLTIFHLYIF